MNHPLDRVLSHLLEKTELSEKANRDDLMRLGAPAEVAGALEAAQWALVTPTRTGRHGLFVVVSGMDKSGKETHSFNPAHKVGLTSIEDFFTARGLSVMPVLQPSYDTLIGSIIAKYLGSVESEPLVSANLAWVLWSLDRAQHNASVSKWLLNGDGVVLAKRWTESNIVYQEALGIDVRRVLNFERNLVKPDLSLILDIPPELFSKRLGVADADLYERYDLMKRVRKGYLKLTSIYRWGYFIYVDSTYDEREVNDTILDVLEVYLKRRAA